MKLNKTRKVQELVYCYMLGSKVQDMRFGSYIQKYKLLVWDIYGFELSNFNSQLLKYDLSKVHIIWYQRYYHVSQCDVGGDVDVEVLIQGQLGASIQPARMGRQGYKSGDMLRFKMLGISIGSHIRKYGLLVYDLYGLDPPIIIANS